jgi:drug/metabolite transporter (DMT)-like permease
MALMCLAAFCFACMDTIGKYLVARLPVIEVAWARYMASCILVMALFMPRMGRRLWRTNRPGIQLVRGGLLAASSSCFILSLAYLPLAEMVALTFVAPIVVALLSGPFLGERVGRVLWLGTIGGFAGVLIVLRPGGDVFHWASLLPIAAALNYGVYQILTRKISTSENPVTSLFHASWVGALALSLPLPWVWQTPPDAVSAGLLALMGAVAGVAHYAAIKAVEAAPPSALAPYTYTQLVWAIVFGLALFGQFPDLVTLVGMAVIVGSAMGVSLAGARRRAP